MWAGYEGKDKSPVKAVWVDGKWIPDEEYREMIANGEKV